MTQRFKDAVKKVVADGVITDDEKALVMSIAKEEGINEKDALIYLLGELKKKKGGLTKTEIWDIVKVIGGGLMAVAAFVFQIMKFLTELEDKKGKK